MDDNVLSPLGIHILFAKSVPHILERIFFSLDQKSFDACRVVCVAWDQLLASRPFRKRYKQILEEKRQLEEELLELEEELLDSSCVGDAQEVGRLLSRGVDKNCESGSGHGSGYEAEMGYWCEALPPWSVSS